MHIAIQHLKIDRDALQADYDGLSLKANAIDREALIKIKQSIDDLSYAIKVLELHEKINKLMTTHYGTRNFEYRRNCQ